MGVLERRLALAVIVALGTTGPETAAAGSVPAAPPFSGGLLDGLPSYVPRDPFSGQSLHSIRETPTKKTNSKIMLRTKSVTDVKTSEYEDKTLAGIPSYRTQDPFAQLDA